MVLKINPADVVSIPTDYNDAKGRACRYEVIDEIGGEDLVEDAFTAPVQVTSNTLNTTDDIIKAAVEAAVKAALAAQAAINAAPVTPAAPAPDTSTGTWPTPSN